MLDLYMIMMNSPLLGGTGAQAGTVTPKIRPSVSQEDLASPTEKFKGKFDIPSVSLELRDAQK